MESSTQKRALGLQDKIPDIQKTLDTVRFLASRDEASEPLDSFFELNDTLYAKASVARTEEVYLWLGANVMLSYPLKEAEELLVGKLEAAQASLGNCEEDLEFLREQITVSARSVVYGGHDKTDEVPQTMEVATARVYNWDVNERRREKASSKGGVGDGGKSGPDG